jgi:hypothetical protein
MMDYNQYGMAFIYIYIRKWNNNKMIKIGWTLYTKCAPRV